MADTIRRDGSRSIELLLPFEYLGKRYETINFRPFTWDHAIRWNEGKFPSLIALVAEMAGLEEHALRELRYPDVDRVLSLFSEMLPASIRDSIATARPPQAMVDNAEEMETTNLVDYPQQSSQTPVEHMESDDGLGFDVDEPAMRTGTNG